MSSGHLQCYRTVSTRSILGPRLRLWPLIYLILTRGTARVRLSGLLLTSNRTVPYRPPVVATGLPTVAVRPLSGNRCPYLGHLQWWVPCARLPTTPYPPRVHLLASTLSSVQHAAGAAACRNVLSRHVTGASNESIWPCGHRDTLLLGTSHRLDSD